MGGNISAASEGTRTEMGAAMHNETFSVVAKRFFIATATNELCKKTGLDDLVVDDLCAASGVSRSGFYRAFHSKYDIAPWCLQFPLEEGVGKMGRSLTCREGITVTLEIFALFKDLFSAAKKTSEMRVSDTMETQQVVDLVKRNLEECHSLAIDETLDFQIKWVTTAGLQISEEWIAGSIDKTPAELAELFARCYPAPLRKYLDNPLERTEDSTFDLSRLVTSLLKR